MEINRSIEVEKIHNILNRYKENNIEEIIKFNRILKDLEKKLLIGQKMINERYNYKCGEILDKIKIKFPETLFIKETTIENLVEVLKDDNKNYDIKSFYLDQLKRCKKYSTPKFDQIHSNLKNKFETIKKQENKMFSKCVVFEHDEVSIEKCLYMEFRKFKLEMVENIRTYYDEFEKFKKCIYI